MEYVGYDPPTDPGEPCEHCGSRLDFRGLCVNRFCYPCFCEACEKPVDKHMRCPDGCCWDCHDESRCGCNPYPEEEDEA